MFMLCASSCFSAAEAEQAQSKKGLKKQQKEAEKAAKKAEKQAKLVGGLFFFLIHIRRPLVTAVRASLCRAVGHCESRRALTHSAGEPIHCSSIPVILVLFTSTKQSSVFLYTDYITWDHRVRVATHTYGLKY